ncbi:hypothetical protein DFH06DRAFT_1475169 [Mycena polygramma]|nr:hypothetical protein DFH06DRAFT_1475169 [Mycena polygramma]
MSLRISHVAHGFLSRPVLDVSTLVWQCLSPFPPPPPPPIHSLPAELVREIVRVCCQNCGEIILPFPHPPSPAVCLSQFCSTWRAAAHSERALWQEFRVNMPDDLTAGQYEALMNFIANGAPQNVSSLSLRQGAYRPRYENTVLPVVITHARCLQSLSLNFPGQAVEQLFATAALPFDNLQTLSIAIRVVGEDDIYFLQTPAEYVTKMFTNTPVLTSVTLGYDLLMPITFDAFPLEAWNLPWAQLTEFHAPNVWIEVIGFFTIVDLCPNLVGCVLTVDAQGAEDPETDDKRITLVHLRKFHITFLELYSWVWTNLNLPSLVDLKIATFRDATIWEQEEFQEFMDRSQFSLTRLALCFGFLNVIDALIEILDATPALQDLTLCWTRLPGDEWYDEEGVVTPLTDYLTYHISMPVRLPELQKIRIDATPESVAMLVSRCCAPGAALKEVVLCAEQPSTCETLFAAEIDAMRAGGATVVCEPMIFPPEKIYDPIYREDSSDEGTDPPSVNSEPEVLYPLTYVPP